MPCCAVPCRAVLCRALLRFLFRAYQTTTLASIQSWRAEPACPRAFLFSSVEPSFSMLLHGPFLMLYRQTATNSSTAVECTSMLLNRQHSKAQHSTITARRNHPCTKQQPKCVPIRVRIKKSMHSFVLFCRVSLFVPLFWPPRRPYAGICFLVFVLFRPCSSYLFLFSTHVVLLAAFLIFLHHILQKSCRLSCRLVLVFLLLLVWLVFVMCSRTRYASISLALP